MSTHGTLMKDFRLELAKSGASKCGVCEEKIAKVPLQIYQYQIFSKFFCFEYSLRMKFELVKKFMILIVPKCMVPTTSGIIFHVLLRIAKNWNILMLENPWLVS